MSRPQKNNFVTILFALSLWITLAFGTAAVHAAPNVSPVGYVDFIYLVGHHPDTEKANEVLRAEQEAAKKEFAEKSAGLNEADRISLDQQLGQRVEQKRLEILKPISDKVVAAAKEVTTAQGLSIVIDKREVVCGGVDITQEVLAKITGK